MEVIIYGYPTGIGTNIKWDNPNQAAEYFKTFQHRKLRFIAKPDDKLSAKQRMYDFYHKAILDAAMLAFTAMGWESMDKYKADILLKDECAKDVMVNESTGEEIIFTVDKSTMTKERLHKFLVDCIFFLESQHGIVVLSADEWRESKL